MVPATDSAQRAGTRLVLLGFALSVLLGEPGCARLRSFRKDDRPSFGTDSGASLDAPAGRQALAARDPERGPRSTPSRKTRDGSLRPLPVALHPPEPLPTGGESSPKDEVANPPIPPQALAEGAEAPPAEPETLAGLLRQSRERLDGLSSYQLKMSHQERVGGTLNPPEDVILSVRRRPRAVRLEWPAGGNKGREVLYAEDVRNGLMHVKMVNSPIPRISMAPDSPLATRNSRHPITEAGYDTILENMERAEGRQRSGDFSLGRITYQGLEKPEGLDTDCHKVVRVTPTDETWVVYLNPANQLPLAVKATASNGDLLERYAFLDPEFNLPELAGNEAFDPDARWGPPQGLFQRLARGGSAPKPETEAR